jgi:hypothetical protein
VNAIKKWWKRLWCSHVLVISHGGVWCRKCEYWEH